jgi:transcriptional antiterminator RfaH
MTSHWILVVSQHGKERLATQNIGRQGFQYYLPLIRESIVKNGSKIEVAKPLFPRYIFVFIEQQWSALTGTYGVSGLVMDGKNPRYVPERVVETLKKREDKDGFVQLDEEEGLKEGQEVRISSGILEGHTGIFERMDADERAIILFKMLGVNRSLPVNLKVLQAI